MVRSMRLKELEEYLSKEFEFLLNQRQRLGLGYDQGIRRLEGYLFYNIFTTLYYPTFIETFEGIQNLLSKGSGLTPALKDEAKFYEEFAKFSMEDKIKEILEEIKSGKRREEAEIGFPITHKAQVIEEITRGLDFLDYMIGRNRVMQITLNLLKKYKTSELARESIKEFGSRISSSLHELGKLLNVLNKTSYSQGYYELPSIPTCGLMTYMIIDACEGSVLPRVFEENNLRLPLERIPLKGLGEYFNHTRTKEVEKEIMGYLQNNLYHQTCLASIKKFRIRNLEKEIREYYEKMKKRISSNSEVEKSYIV